MNTFQRLRDWFADLWWYVRTVHMEGVDGVCADYE